MNVSVCFFFFSSRRRHTRLQGDWSSDVCSSDLPSYFASHPKPTTPRDLTSHRCINFRHGSDGVYRWEFDKGKQSLTVAVQGPLIVDDVELIARAAIDGVGLAFMAEESAAPHLASGALVRVLEDWCPPYPGFFLYYPSRRQLPAALLVLVETLRL